MSEMNSEKRDEVYKDFNDHVNMQPKELKEWLETEESKAVGISDGGESKGHASGRQIIEIKQTKKDKLTEEQYEHMLKVVNYIKRHKAQKPSSDIEHSNWRYSLMNWGHDPLMDN